MAEAELPELGHVSLKYRWVLAIRVFSFVRTLAGYPRHCYTQKILRHHWGTIKTLACYCGLQIRLVLCCMCVAATAFHTNF